MATSTNRLKHWFRRKVLRRGLDVRPGIQVTAASLSAPDLTAASAPGSTAGLVVQSSLSEANIESMPSKRPEYPSDAQSLPTASQQGEALTSQQNDAVDRPSDQAQAFGQFFNGSSNNTFRNITMQNIMQPSSSIAVTVTRDSNETPSSFVEGRTTSQPPTQVVQQANSVSNLVANDTSGCSRTFNQPVMQNIKANHVTTNNITNAVPDAFLKDFVRYTMPGSFHDSSARDPPPRCHPGTRLATVERARGFFDASRGMKKLLWIVGPAGVGKSAIMQTIAETSPNLGASCFFTVNVRDDPSKFVATLVYQLAIKFPRYKDFLAQKVTRDPTIMEKAIEVQFDHLLIQAFGASETLIIDQPFMVLVDGLDECGGDKSDPGMRARSASEMQSHILELISLATRNQSYVPLFWIVASRPEPHITSFFEEMASDLYEKIEVAVDSDESRSDVERFLRNELDKLRTKFASLAYLRLPRWPLEHQFLPLAEAADGLFAFAEVAVRFIGDSSVANPSSQLDFLLKVVKYRHPSSQDKDPMKFLYAVYEHIMSRIPPDVMLNTRRVLIGAKNLLVTATDADDGLPWDNLAEECRWLGLTPGDCYSALHHLHSVLRIPSFEDGGSSSEDRSNIRPYHRSFIEFLAPKFPSTQAERDLLVFKSAVRILNDIPTELPVDLSISPYEYIVLHWPTGFWYGGRKRLYDLASRLVATSSFLKNDIREGDPQASRAIRVMHIAPRAIWSSLELQTCGYAWFLVSVSLSLQVHKVF
ncbi:hypothetical protein NP233_g3316 [Leucocoprinus birnbaumii]|uniref:Nephrocystin 3-like N-terminal domain-containing protein n=1 Tax=Leucocoprinus birnbaumii TaxID=56174 RepID=A0AAD5YSY0_9AGAR|nr:hypothetical protein NP233_g3316 [Leucocoprinus birnbaumii]